MKIYYDDFQRPEPSKVYLCTPTHKILCPLNGVQEDSFSLKENLNNAYEISFDVDRFIINEEKKQVESNGYEWIQLMMRLYVDNIGWFICSPPSVSNDGLKEIKTVNASSCEIEMVQHDLKNLKINCGTTDSYEMLVDGNVEILDGNVEFAKEQIKFYNPENPNLSLLNILLKVSGLYGWTIGHIDNIPKEYKYYENGELKTKYVSLADEIGMFDVEVQDLYSFITQDMAQYFNCVFLFDIKNLTINAYRPENIGKDTNINIGFRNIQNSNDITIDENNIFTVYTVSGADELGITYVNGGSNEIENIEYFLNEKYLSAEVIKKYKLWLSDLEINRPLYIENTRLYNAQLDVISELKNRLPLDDCSTDWSTFPDEELLEAQANYQAQLRGYEDFYVDDNGEFDEDALKASVDANDYYQIKDVILPSIQIEIDNRQLDSSKDPTEYIDSYKTDWKLYGLDELQVKLDEYKNIIAVAKKGKYDVPYSEDSGHTEDYHNTVYAKYLDAINQLDENYEGSCQYFYNLRQSEIDEANAILEEYNASRKSFAEKMNKETWQNGDAYFTSKDLAEFSKVYVDNTYTNENMFLLSSDTAVTAIDEQLKLLEAAKDDLSSASQPQFIYSTNLDNFLAQYEYRDYTSNLNLGDFVWLGVRDDYVVKLRVISISYNPLVMDNNLQIEFSNMISSRAKRDDFTYLLGNTSGRGKTASSGSGGDYTTNEGVGLTSGLISKLLANGSFKNTVNQWIEEGMAINGGNIIAGSGGSSGEISIEQLNSKMIKVVDIVGENAFFEYLQSKLISTDKIVADSGVFDELEALVAKIDNLIAGTISAEDFHALKLTVDNAVIDDAVIRDLIAAQITVAMLKAGDISTEKFNIISDDGGLKIVGNTMQFYDADGNIRIQIGRDANDDFTFTLYDSDGTGVLIDENGIHESAITDGLIKNEMIEEGTIEKDRLGFPIVETDENGKVSITEILNGDGEPLGVTITEIQNTVTELGDKLEETSNYSIILENEYQNIPCVNGVAKEHMLIEIPFIGYKGTTQIATSAVVGLLPNGVLLGEKTDSTDTESGKIILNVFDNADFGGTDILTGYISITFTIDDTQIVKRFTWSKTNDGDAGVAKVYSLDASANVIIKGIDEDENTTLSPADITFSAYLKEGETRSEYYGRFVIQTSTDGSTYDNVYMSVDDETSVTFEPTSDLRSIKCTLYKSGGVTDTIEVRTVTLLDDNSQALSEITEVKESVVQLSSTVDKNTQAITDKVWTSDITTEINNYDQETVKTIRDTVAEHTVSIGNITSKVSDVESTLSQKADGSTVTSLTEKVSTLEQDAEGFKQTVSETYVSNEKLDNTLADYSTTKEVESAIDQKANEITLSVSETYATNASVSDLSNELKSDMANLQDQIDGAIESWFYDPIPTLGNEPAVNWTTDEQKNIHLGDLYYASNGRCYRFQMSGDEYIWQEIQDTDITKAIADAASAQETANEKRRVFIVEPTTPYDVGDLWINDSDGKMYKCTTTRSSGTFISSDWEVATDYQTATQVSASIKIETDKITEKIEASDGKISEVEQSLTSISQRVDNAEGNISKLTVRADEIEGSVTDVENNMTSLINQTASEIRSEVKSGDDALSSQISQTANEINSTIEGLNGQITTNKQDIESITQRVKTSENNYSELKLTVDEIESEVFNEDGSSKIEQTANEILSTVSATYATQSDLEATQEDLKTAESAIKQNAENIALKVSTTTLSETLEGYSTKTETATAISESEKGIALSYATKTELTDVDDKFDDYSTTEDMNKAISAAITVSENGIMSNVTNAIDDIEIGGRNLLLNTNTTSGKAVIVKGATQVTSGISSWTNTSGVLTLNGSVSGAECYYRFMSPSNTNLYTLEAGNDYTISGKLKISTTSGTLKSVNIRSQHSITSWTGGLSQVVTDVDSDEWVEFAFTHSIPEDALGAYFSVQVFYSSSWAGVVQLTELKLEKGNKATDWTPAPEDMATSEDVTTLSTRIIQTEDTIQSQATAISNNTTNISTLTQTATSITARLDSLQIGGRNLISGTSEENKELGGYPSSGYTEGVTGKTIGIPTGDSYVLSFEAKSTVSGDVIRCHFYSPNTTTGVEVSTGYTGTSGDGHALVELTDSWEKYWIRYTQNGANTTSQKNWIVGRRFKGEGTGTISVRSIKLEEGEYATDWTPAPEDVDSDVEDAKKQATNYLNLSEDGLVVGNMEETTDEESLGANVRIRSDGLDIRDCTTVLASFDDDCISLGNTSENATIYMCNKKASMTSDSKGRFKIQSDGTVICSEDKDGNEGIFSYITAFSSIDEEGNKFTSASLQLETDSSGGSDMAADLVGELDLSYSQNNPGSKLKGWADNITFDGLNGISLSSSSGSITANGFTLAENKTLWSGAYYMTASHSCTLSEAVSAQTNGIVLIFSAYRSSASQNYEWKSYFIPKQLIASHGRNSHVFVMNSVGFGYIAAKNLYVSNTTVTGNNSNTSTGTKNGVTYANNSFVLRYVIGV